MVRRRPPMLLRLLLLSAVLAAQGCAAAAQDDALVAPLIKGKITTSTDVFSVAPIVSGASAAVEVTLTSRDGRRVARTFADRDGWFAFADVPTPPALSAAAPSSAAAGAPDAADAKAAAARRPASDYLLSVTHPDYLYPDVLLQVDASRGAVRAMFAQNRAPIPASPYLVVPPISRLQYFEARKPLDVWGLVKSPYGLMVVFMVFSIFVMPMLKVDPEEYREAMDTLSGRGGNGGAEGEGGGDGGNGGGNGGNGGREAGPARIGGGGGSGGGAQDRRGAQQRAGGRRD